MADVLVLHCGDDIIIGEVRPCSKCWMHYPLTRAPMTLLIQYDAEASDRDNYAYEEMVRRAS